MKHIMLIGFMGSGKTTVGRQLAAAMKRPFIDMDAEIIKSEGMPITQIFSERGEEYFRKLETQLLQELSRNTVPMVISAGGGVPIQPQNQSCLKELGMVVLLQTSTDVLVERLQGDNSRPILHGGELHNKISELQRQREPIYGQVSDTVITTDRKTIEEIVQEIQARIQFS